MSDPIGAVDLTHRLALSSATPQKNAAPLTAEQKKALGNLHNAASQFEGVFLTMVMKSMRDTVPQSTLFGQDSQSEKTWQAMLDDEYSQQMAKSGGFGLAAQLEQQLRNVVLANAKNEAGANVDDRRIEP
jgi:flagellar protein FlgJ